MHIIYFLHTIAIFCLHRFLSTVYSFVNHFHSCFFLAHTFSILQDSSSFSRLHSNLGFCLISVHHSKNLSRNILNSYYRILPWLDARGRRILGQRLGPVATQHPDKLGNLWICNRNSGLKSEQRLSLYVLNTHHTSKLAVRLFASVCGLEDQELVGRAWPSLGS